LCEGAERHHADVVLVPRCDLYVLTGEQSGDAYAGAMLRRLRHRCGGIECAAMGGGALQAAGAEVEQGIDDQAVMGFFPVLQRLPEFLALERRVSERVRRRRPRVVVSIDYPGFNLRLQRRLAELRRAGTRLVHVVAPQVWAWRPRRAKTIARSVDRLLCFFPFEPPLFRRFGCQADFVGHPLVDMVAESGSARRAGRELGLEPGDRLLLLAPGSRAREVQTLLPVFDRAARLALPRLAAEPGGRVVVAVSKTPDLPRELYRAATDFPLIEDAYLDLCRRARLGLIASGTATLQAALTGLPHCIAYRGDEITARIMRHLVRIDDIGLPNIVHGRRVVPEFIQRDVEPVRMAARLVALWHRPRWDAVHATLNQTAQILGGGGAMDRIADALAEELAIGRHRADTFGEP
jgi:lipid-A-disaccharide synthase